MKKYQSLCFALFFALSAIAQNIPPHCSNISVSTNAATHLLTVQYDLADPDDNWLIVYAELSDNEGKTYDVVPTATPEGHIGAVVPGVGKLFTWDLSSLNPAPTAAFRLRLTALDERPFVMEELVGKVDSNRLRADLVLLEGVRHRTAGLPKLQACRDSIMQLFDNQRIGKGIHTFLYNNFQGQNLIGYHPGITTESHKVVIVDGHYDTVNNSPGADDNGTGVVGMMEIARLLSPYPLKRSARYIGFDLEETGLTGSIAYVQTGLLPSDSIDAVLNFEMIGFHSEEPNSQSLPTGFNILFPTAYTAVQSQQFKGNFITNVGNTTSQSLVNQFNTAASTYVPQLRVIDVVAPGNGQLTPDLTRSDHAPFWLSSRKALMLTDGAEFRNDCYHTTKDTLEKLNFTFLAQVVQATLATMATILEPMHGSWEKVDFAFSSAVNDFNGCSMDVFYGNKSLHLRNRTCDNKDMRLQLFNLSGVLVLEASVPDDADAVVSLDRADLPTGVYAVQLGNHKQLFTKKIFIY